MTNFLAGVRGTLPRLWAFLKAVYANLTPSQRRKVYTVAMAAGVALAAKLGIDAATAADWITFGATFTLTVIVPAFAKSKVDDDKDDVSTNGWQGDA